MKYLIKAFYTQEYVRVYQAYSDVIADSALANGTFISPPFSLSRMTWIKPSFLWMMYRSGWGSKDLNQKRILAIDIRHNAFSEILTSGISSNFEQSNFNSIEEWKYQAKNSDVLIQWDPDRDILMNRLTDRTIQIGLRGKAVNKYVNEWIVSISDVTELTLEIKRLILKGEVSNAINKLPVELIYPV